MSKPLPPVKPQEKLPIVYVLTIVKDPDKQSGWFNTVIMEMQGGAVLRRRVLEPAEGSVDRALDDFNKYAIRVFYFNEGAEIVES